LDEANCRRASGGPCSNNDDVGVHGWVNLLASCLRSLRLV
jgi:hypothetical protein